MSIAGVLRLDCATVARIEALTNALPDRRVEPRRNRPYIVLASYSQSVDVGDLDACLATATNRWNRLTITLTDILVHPGNPAMLGLLVAPVTDLLHHHASIQRALTDLPTHPSFEIGTWVPHVMLGRTTLLADAIEVLASIWTGSVIGSAVSLDLVQLDPPQTLSSRPLLG